MNKPAPTAADREARAMARAAARHLGTTKTPVKAAATREAKAVTAYTRTVLLAILMALVAAFLLGQSNCGPDAANSTSVLIGFTVLITRLS